VAGAVSGKQNVEALEAVVEAMQCWPVNYGRILGDSLRQKMVIVLSLCVQKRILSPCSLDLYGQRNSIYLY
jgi:hypothetical protein